MQILNDVLSLATYGIDKPDLGLMAIRGATGVFFAISGYHKLFNADRHAKLKRTLASDNVPFLSFMEWWVPGWEFAAGVTLALGLFSATSAAILTIICIVACCCEAKEKVAKYAPIDFADVVDDYLYLPEVLYILMLGVTMLAGPGKYALDALMV